MRNIQSFTLSKGQINQVAIVDRAAAANDLTEVLYSCEPGYVICHFDTILFPAFFAHEGEVKGTGIANLQFGGSRHSQCIAEGTSVTGP
jgi:hypothetical protein